MSRWTPEEIFEAYAAREEMADRVHWQERVPFAGAPGHLYFLRNRTRPLTHPQLALISFRSRHAEAALMRINDVYAVKLGSAGIANTSIHVPRRQEGIEEFELLAHTHPLEMDNAYDRVPDGPSRADWDALNLLCGRWRQTQSVVVVCRRGRVVAVRPFRADQCGPPDRRGGLWTPDAH